MQCDMSVTEKQILYNFTDMRYFKSSNLQKQKAVQWLPEAEWKEKQEEAFNEQRVSILQDNSSDNLLHNMNILNIFELYKVKIVN